MRTSWDALAAGEAGLTAALAGFSAVHFLRRHARGGRAATLALGLSAAGVALVALDGVSAMLGGGRSSEATLLIGLPALAGQALMAAMVLRKRRR
jgi:hypothetical protein